ncbi:multiple sugar transport system permease protein [Anaeroplasma bactoclasticum]|jgi:multiple sugar transport system permease protein|uniref:Multiple sugar transport system permease protein n=1 Tax=Anaeroplasma bactoclasticum TaxID=2088 RepID=A0A397S2L3_9MOLU|nr:sugar ABC transporter permease [Anaeroplasma bactoclasticum]RIA78197.1 multiple sugar transport system permease protein [Anaeroplasma bactoclasticum]
MKTKNNLKAWLYLLPAILFLAFFTVYPLIDIFVYSFEENYQFTKEATGIGFGNYGFVLNDEKFLSAVKNTILLVIITVPLSTLIALLISVGLNAIKPLRKVLETIFFLPYVTNTLAVGMVFMLLFNKDSQENVGLVNSILGLFGINAIDWVGPTSSYIAKLFVLCFYTIWYVMPFKILVLTGAIASVRKIYYQAAAVDGASRFTVFRKITVPQISPMISYLIITGFIGAFKSYSDAVALFGENLDDAGMNTIVGYVYGQLYSNSGGYPSRASAAAIILFFIILAITCINLLVSRKHVYY